MKKKLIVWLLAFAVLASTLTFFNDTVKAANATEDPEANLGTSKKQAPVSIDITKYRTLEANLPADSNAASADSGSVNTQTNIPVAGVVYVVTKTHDITMTRKDTVNYVEAVTALESPEKYILVTDKKGHIATKNAENSSSDIQLLSGRYTIQELSIEQYGKGEYSAYKAPQGIVANTAVYTVDLPYAVQDDSDARGYTLNYDLKIKPKNLADTAAIEITKKKITDVTGTEEVALADVIYQIYEERINSDGKKTYVKLTKYPINGQDIGVLKTDASGKLTVSNLSKGVNYMLVEQVPAGYIANEQSYILTATTNATAAESKHTFLNTQVSKKVSANGTDFTNNNTNVSIETPFDYQVTTKLPTSSKDKDGKYFPVIKYEVIDNLQQLDGKYYHYFTNVDDIKLMLDSATGTDITNYFTITPVTGTVGTASDKIVGFKAVLKADYLNDKYPTSLDGKVLYVKAKAIIDKSYITDNKTEQLHNKAKVNVGRNVTVPDPDQPSEDPDTPSETPEKPTTPEETPSNEPDVPVTPISGGFKVVKHELGDENAKIQNAGFTLYAYSESAENKRGDVVRAEQMTDQQGETSFTNLPLGKYVLVETTKPKYKDGEVNKDYLSVDENSQRIVTVAANDTIESHQEKVANRKSKWYLPGTGGTGTTALIMFGTACLMLAAILVIAKKRRHAHEA